MVISLRTARGIVLDVDGTVYSLSRGVGDIYAEVLDAEGLSGEPALLNRVAGRVWREMLSEYLNVSGRYATTAEREEAFWLRYAEAVVRDAGIVSPAPYDTARRIYEAFSLGKYRTVSPGVIEFVHKARGAGISVFAASNNDLRTKTALRELGIYDCFDGVVVASDLGWKKPSVAYFQELADKMRIEAGGCAHIGNDPELDVAAAERAGWRGVLYSEGEATGPQRLGSFFDAAALF